VQSLAEFQPKTLQALVVYLFLDTGSRAWGKQFLRVVVALLKIYGPYLLLKYRCETSKEVLRFGTFHKKTKSDLVNSLSIESTDGLLLLLVRDAN
jgi:hypothetical protein